VLSTSVPINRVTARNPEIGKNRFLYFGDMGWKKVGPCLEQGPDDARAG
jgi:hypothetical protein